MDGIARFATGAPLWVWPLLVGLVFVGLKASKDRTTLTLPIYFLPLLGLLSLNAVNGLSVEPKVWVLFAATYWIGATFGFRFQSSVVLGRSGKSITLKGEWVTMLALMVIFWLNFVGGVFKAVSPDIYTSSGFHLVFAAIAGLVAGSFFGRALWVFRA